MTVKNARKLTAAILIVGTVVMLLSYIWEPFLIIGAVIDISCLIPHFLFNRCPHCGKLLGRDVGDFCQHCGKKLEQ